MMRTRMGHRDEIERRRAPMFASKSRNYTRSRQSATTLVRMTSCKLAQKSAREIRQRGDEVTEAIS